MFQQKKTIAMCYWEKNKKIDNDNLAQKMLWM